MSDLRPQPPLQIFLVRHGETAWSSSGQHTGRTDIPLTERGEREARALEPRLGELAFDYVFSSPLIRARRTAELAGFGDRLTLDPDLVEWDYGDYEGLTSPEIYERHPRWVVFDDGGPNGESPAQVRARADRFVQRLRGLRGNVIIFAHGHFGRALAVRWLGLALGAGEHFPLATASVSILGFHPRHPEVPVIARWNAAYDGQLVPD